MSSHLADAVARGAAPAAGALPDAPAAGADAPATDRAGNERPNSPTSLMDAPIAVNDGLFERPANDAGAAGAADAEPPTKRRPKDPVCLILEAATKLIELRRANPDNVHAMDTTAAATVDVLCSAAQRLQATPALWWEPRGAAATAPHETLVSAVSAMLRDEEAYVGGGAAAAASVVGGGGGAAAAASVVVGGGGAAAAAASPKRFALRKYVLTKPLMHVFSPAGLVALHNIARDQSTAFVVFMRQSPQERQAQELYGVEAGSAESAAGQAQ
jgi:hypothetical protein